MEVASGIQIHSGTIWGSAGQLRPRRRLRRQTAAVRTAHPQLGKALGPRQYL